MGKRDKGEPRDRFRLPRARVAIPFELTIGEGGRPRFSAKLPSRDLSVSGTFLESSYFLPVGTRMRVSFQLDEGEEPLHASAEIVRHEKTGRSGFALRFFEFEGKANVAVTELVLGEQLHNYVDRYLASRRARSLKTEAERMVDLIASWELHRATKR
jgi:hypothetical protein